MTGRIFLHEIADAVAREWGHSVPVLRGTRGVADVIQARHAGIWLGRRLTDRSLGTIARQFGRTDHSTAINACSHIDAARAADGILDARLNRLELQLRTRNIERAANLQAQAA